MKGCATLALAAPIFVLMAGRASADDGKTVPSAQAVFQIHHELTVKDIPTGSKKLRVWFWLPDDTPEQKVLQLSVPAAPERYKITRDAANGHRYIYAEQNDPPATVAVATDFVLARRSTSVRLDPAKAGPITDSHRKLFAEYLDLDCPCMKVDATITDLAKKLCGEELNVVTQARKIFDWVVANTDHYSKAKTSPKSSGQGSALYCLNHKGGGCTDQHALFIALCRARGIPTRLHFGTLLKAQNEGKELNPGYRCWVQYFVPNYGWVSADLSAANTNPGQEDFYFSGLDERRVWFAEGRNLELQPRQDTGKLNLLIIAHVEVDGRVHTAFDRTLRFTRAAGDALK